MNMFGCLFSSFEEAYVKRKLTGRLSWLHKLVDDFYSATEHSYRHGDWEGLLQGSLQTSYNFTNELVE